MREFGIYLTEFHFGTVLIRLVLAMAAGGFIGIGRSKKRREVGLRTFMLISLGAAITVLLALYENEMLNGAWASVVASVGAKFDGSRYASQVLSGIGFLGAGTILSNSHLQVRGLTSASGLFAAAAMGMAAGAGFYEVVIIAMFMIALVMELLYPVEIGYKRRQRNLTVYVEYTAMEDVSKITEVILARKAQIYEVDVERSRWVDEQPPAAVITVKLSKEKMSHSGMLSSIAELPCVYSIQELIS